MITDELRSEEEITEEIKDLSRQIEEISTTMCELGKLKKDTEIKLKDDIKKAKELYILKSQKLNRHNCKTPCLFLCLDKLYSDMYKVHQNSELQEKTKEIMGTFKAEFNDLIQLYEDVSSALHEPTHKSQSCVGPEEICKNFLNYLSNVPVCCKNKKCNEQGYCTCIYQMPKCNNKKCEDQGYCNCDAQVPKRPCDRCKESGYNPYACQIRTCSCKKCKEQGYCNSVCQLPIDVCNKCKNQGYYKNCLCKKSRKIEEFETGEIVVQCNTECDCGPHKKSPCKVDDENEESEEEGEQSDEKTSVQDKEDPIKDLLFATDPRYKPDDSVELSMTSSDQVLPAEK